MRVSTIFFLFFLFYCTVCGVKQLNKKHRHAKRAGVIFSIDWVAWGKTGC